MENEIEIQIPENIQPPDEADVQRFVSILADIVLKIIAEQEQDDERKSA